MLFAKKRGPAVEKAPDNEIVGRVLSGEREAFNTLVVRWLPSAHACAFSHLANHTEAEDATQEAFIKAYQLLDQLRDADKFGAWLIAIVRNAANRLGSRRNRETALTPEHESKAVAPAPDMGRLEMQQNVRNQVLLLEEADREVLMLHYFTGKSTPEIGELLGISPDAVRKRLQRAREALGERLVTEAADALKPPRSTEERTRAVLAAIAVCRVSWKPRTPAGKATGKTGAATQGTGIFANKAAMGIGFAVIALMVVITAYVKSRPADTTPTSSMATASTARTTAPSSSDAPPRSPESAASATAPTPAGSTQAPAATLAKDDAAVRTIHGVVRTTENQPVAGARIETGGSEAAPSKGAPARQKITSDASGHYTVGWNDTIKELDLFALGFGRERIQCAAMPLDADVEIQSALNLTRMMSGRQAFTGAFVASVTDGSGAPLNGVTVRAGNAKGDVIATTAATGIFHVEPSFSDKNLYLEADGYAPETVLYHTNYPIAVVMRRPGGLRVRVTKAGVPVSGATVRVNGADNSDVVTDASGVAMFAALPAPLAYSVGLHNYADAYEVTGRTSVVEGKTVDCELHVVDRYPATCRGSVLDADGNPVKGAELLIQQADSPANPRRISTDASGAFAAGLTAGTNRIIPNPASIKKLFKDQGLTEASYEVKVENGAGDIQHDFHLKRINPHVTVRLMDGGGNPVTRAEISILPGLQADNSKFVVTAPDGSFTTTREYANLIHATDPARKRMGYATVPSGADVVDVRMNTTVGKIVARAVDQDGKPVPSVQAYATFMPGQDDLAANQNPFDSGTVRGVSDNKGRLVFEPLPVGASYVVSAWSAEYAVLSYNPSNRLAVASENPEELRITLGAATAVVSGRVVDDSRNGVANACVSLNSADFNHLNFSRQAFSDESGHFSAKVVKGEYGVCASRMAPTAINSETITISAPASDIVLVVPRGEKTLAPQSPELAQASNMMKQLGLVFKMFAGENKDKYPQLSKTFGVFSPDLTQIYPEYLTDATIADRLAGKLDVKTSYLGFLANDEDSGMRVLDAYEQLGPEGLGDPDTLRQYNESISGDQTGTSLHPLREGIERFIITDINNPAGSAQAQSSIPITWEMPGPLRPDGGYVLYMDGHVEWVSYPGKFPMTEQFIGRLNALSGSKTR